MQHRYVGDIGDFVKLAILRAVYPAGNLGVAWWLFPDECHNGDGRHTTYLQQPERWRALDPVLFDTLGQVVAEGERNVHALQDARLLTGAQFADEVLPVGGSPADRRNSRVAWFERVQAKLAASEVVFVDPDNGLETAGFSPGTAVAGKSISVAELLALAAGGRAVIAYHHQTRMKGGHLHEIGYWQQRLRASGFNTADAIRATPYSPRAFFLLDAPQEMRAKAARLVQAWGGRLSWHPDTDT